MSAQRKGPADHLDANGHRTHLDEWGRDVNRPLSEEELRARDRQDAHFARLRAAHPGQSPGQSAQDSVNVRKSSDELRRTL